MRGLGSSSGLGPLYPRHTVGRWVAKYDPNNSKWAKCSPPVVNDLVRENPIYLGLWSEAFRPIRNRLLAPLSAIYRDHTPEKTAERNLATGLLADYAAGQPQVLADLVMDGDDRQFAVIFSRFQEQAERGLPLVIAEMDRTLPANVPSSDERREMLADRAVAWAHRHVPGCVGRRPLRHSWHGNTRHRWIFLAEHFCQRLYLPLALPSKGSVRKLRCRFARALRQYLE